MTRSTRRRFVKGSLALCAMALSAPAVFAADGFSAGFATTDITPPVGWRRAGNYTELISTGVHDPLFAKAIVLSQGTTTVAFFGNDLCSVPRELTDRARKRASEKTEIPFANIVITATHTHGAPEYYGPPRDFLHARALNENGGKDPREPIDYHALLVERWAEVFVKAHAARQPVTLSVVVPQQEGMAFNRRFQMKDGSTGWNPGKLNTNIFRPLGPTDPDLPFLLVRDAVTDKPLGSLTVFAMHTATDLVNSDLIANLATPSRISNTSWIQPGIAAWDSWWTGINANLPQHVGLWTRGDTRAHKDYIDFAEEVLKIAARHKLTVDFHGAYKPTGLARTWPNYITQEGVLGNGYHKIALGKCTPQHTITLPFTRGLLGPMDVTPGGFLNRTAAEFKMTQPAEVIGTRARELAMTVVFESALLVLCDHPANYRGALGIDYFRGLPTVWDETVGLSAELARHLIIARHSGDRWWLAAMNADAPLKLKVPLKFLGDGAWKLRAFADTPESATMPVSVAESSTGVASGDTLEITLAPAGGYAAVLTPVK